MMPEIPHILLVDDEEEIVNFMQHFLKRFSIPSTRALSGEDALKLYDKKSMKFVFLDIRMNGMDGFTVLRRLKLIDPHVKVIMIAGTSDHESIKKARELGALDYITKPLDLVELRDKISRYITVPQ